MLTLVELVLVAHLALEGLELRAREALLVAQPRLLRRQLLELPLVRHRRLPPLVGLLLLPLLLRDLSRALGERRRGARAHLLRVGAARRRRGGGRAAAARTSRRRRRRGARRRPAAIGRRLGALRRKLQLAACGADVAQELAALARRDAAPLPLGCGAGAGLGRRLLPTLQPLPLRFGAQLALKRARFTRDHLPEGDLMRLLRGITQASGGRGGRHSGAARRLRRRLGCWNRG